MSQVVTQSTTGTGNIAVCSLGTGEHTIEVIASSTISATLQTATSLNGTWFSVKDASDADVTFTTAAKAVAVKGGRFYRLNIDTNAGTITCTVNRA